MSRMGNFQHDSCLCARLKTARFQIAAVSILMFALLAPLRTAIAGNLDKVILFNIQAETLDKALLQFGAQAHVQISFASDSARIPMPTRQIKGHYRGRDALAKLLEGTELRFVAHGNTVEIIVHSQSGSTRSRAGSEKADPSAMENDRRGPSTTYAGPFEDGRRAENSPNRSTPLTEVIVTGSRLPTASSYGEQNVQIYDLDQIEQSGQTSVGEFLSTIPQASVLAGNETSTGQQSTVRLRGLPAGTTLVLLNGRRLENSGFSGGNVFNLDAIPLAAVQRIEVVPNGSSAIYGADAIAGVVNIILKKDFNGVAVDAKYGSAKDFSTVRTNVALGKQGERGGISLIATFGADGGFLHSQRLLTASNDYTRFGGPDLNYPDCSPANIFSIDGSPLPGAPAGSSASYAAVTGPASSGKPGLSNFAYGTLNECSLTSGESILPSTHHAGLLLEGHLQVTSGVQLFAELMYTVENTNIKEALPGLFGTTEFQLYSVSASNPFNPFGEVVGVGMTIPGLAPADNFDTDFFRPLVGLKGALGERWQWELSAWQSTDWTQSVVAHEIPNASSIQAALNSPDPAIALNVFVNGPVARQSVLDSLFGNEAIKFMSRDRSAEAFIRGPVVHLPAGDAVTVLGGDYVQSALDENDVSTGGIYPPNFRQNHKRKYEAAFGEARVPLIGKVGSAPRLLTLTIAGRHDHYSDFGSASTGQFGVEVRPVDGLTIRGAYADAFKAPTLDDLYGSDVSYQTVLVDPVSGELAEPNVMVGGNSALRPMSGHSHMFGVQYTTWSVPGLLLSATQWGVEESEVIQSVDPQVLADNATTFPGRVIRNGAGQITEIIDTEVNFGSIDVAGLDYQLSYQRPIGRGTWSMAVDATEIYRYLQALVPGTQPIGSVSKGEDDGDWAPRWKGTVATGWQEDRMTAHVDGRYTGSYQDYDSEGRRIGNIWIVDANLRWTLAGAMDRTGFWPRKSYVEAGATNLFNRSPQFSNYLYDSVGYDPTQMSIVGRTLYLRLGARW